jgi:uncharacterized protein YjbI with pentapeptide repeats/formylglycine-generating enzyme required for sulfatase activity
MAPGGTLRMVFEADDWDSMISFAPGIPVALGGTLELTFAEDVNPATQLGHTLKIFDWTGVNPTGAFAVDSPYDWDLSNLYTTGEVTFTAIPEPATLALFAFVMPLAALCRRRDSRQKSFTGKVASRRRLGRTSIGSWTRLLCVIGALAVPCAALRRVSLILPVLISVVIAAQSLQAVTFDWATVDNPGNAPDTQIMNDGTTGYGGVDYTYRISKHEVTNAQYTEFLNAVDPTGGNSLSLYDSRMSSDARGGINFNGGAANGSKYEIKSGRDNNPVVYVKLFDAMRFVNWLENGQGSSGTESGVYTIGTGTNELRSAGAKYWIPSEDEWYKAAYYDPSGVYYDYPTGTDTVPYSDNPGSLNTLDDTNVANFSWNDSFANGYNDGYAVTGSTLFLNSQNYLTDAGAYSLATSPYGTFDQGGNVWELNDTVVTSSSRGLRGGAWHNPFHDLRAGRRGNISAAGQALFVGFRVASAIPEPSTLLLVSVGFAALLVMRSVANYRLRCILQLAAALLPLVGLAAPAHADIFQWEYINPADPSQGKRQSTTLAPDGAGVDAVHGANLAGRNLTMAYMIGADLTGANGSFTNLSNADLSEANLTNGYLVGANVTGASFRQANLGNAVFSGNVCAFDNCQFNFANLTDADFREAHLTDTSFQGTTLTGVDFTDAQIRGADFSKFFELGMPGIIGTGIALDQLYSTASYQAKNLDGIRLLQNNLAGANLAGQNLTNSAFLFATLTEAVLTAADTRGAFLNLPASAITTNLIQSDGHIGGLDLEAGELLVVRDYDDRSNDNGNHFPPIPITVDQHLSMGPGGTLRMVFEEDAWDSTISFAPGIPVMLGGTLELTFAAHVSPATQLGRTFKLFDWTGVTPAGAFAVSGPYRWNLSNLYTTGEVTLTAIPEPSAFALGTFALALVLLVVRRK